MLRVQFKPNLFAIANIGGTCGECFFGGKNKDARCDTIKSRTIGCGQKASWLQDNTDQQHTLVSHDTFNFMMIDEC